ncbi:long-chain-fatty-acid--CoA ligase 1-like [Liolophura sinensis]|uniref:long-chain-fatty-acid--CoA ligase 1-like n=1 Tax=Liolophura sinensis TaxID=3198878 RepID=UPI0031587788
MWSKPQPVPTRIDPEHRSKQLKDGSRIMAQYTDPFSDEYMIEDVRTLYDVFNRGHRLSKHKACLGERTGPAQKYQWITYDEAMTRSRNFGSGLVHLGFQKGDNFGIYSVNNSKWVLTEQACNANSLVTVPLYDSLGPDAFKYIINLTELKVLVCDTVDRARKVVTNSAEIPSLKTIIIMSDMDDDLKKDATEKDLCIYTFEQVETYGINNPHEASPPAPSDLATICFTSGTTGTPKGAMLSHANIVRNASTLSSTPDHIGKMFSAEDCHFSYLPLAHMYERTIQAMMFLHGCRIGFFRGDVKLLVEDMQELKPTIFTAVPRLLNRIYDKIQAGAQGSRIKKFLLDTAIRQKQAEIEQGIVRKDSFWDKLVLHKIQALLGGNVRVITTGSAPLSEEVLKFMRAALGCLIMEGYGQTEATAAVTFQYAGERETGHVGGPVACNYVKLIDVPEMDYHCSDDKGEVCVKGPNVFQGYYKQPELTADAIDEEGWLHTGDIGMWLPNGALKIIDRKKNIYKLAQGEYIAPEKIENVYARSAFVMQAFVDGDSLKTCSMAVIVPDPEVLIPWARGKHLEGELQELCKNPIVKQEVFQDILDVGKSHGLSSLEQVKDIFLCADIFTLDNGLVTPTFKNKRPVLKKFFAEEFDRMYSSVK